MLRELPVSRSHVAVVAAATGAGVFRTGGRLPVLALAMLLIAGPLACAGDPAPSPTIVQREVTVNGETSSFEVSLPPGYTAATAYPLGFGFHGYGRTQSDCRQADCEGLEDQFSKTTIMVYPKSVGDGWVDDETSTQKNLDLFTAVLAAVRAEYTIDASRIWAAGASSGAYFVNLLGCVHGSELQAVFPVAGGMVFSPDQCVPSSAAWLLVHGIDDTHVPIAEGETTRDWVAGRNGCQQRTEPSLTSLREEIRAARTQGRDTLDCVDYVGCGQRLPVSWCEHGQGGYDGSTHGWPTGASERMGAFLDRFAQ
jgi:polyhydroxybutyrate depolymerase